MFKFNKVYFILAVLLLAIEVVIGVYAHDAYIRPYGGDFLVVILLYCLVKSFIKCDIYRTAIAVLIFAYAIEIAQYFHIINLLGLQYNATARLIMGADFAWTDMLMYTLGILLVWLIEKRLKRV